MPQLGRLSSQALSGAISPPSTANQYTTLTWDPNYFVLGSYAPAYVRNRPVQVGDSLYFGIGNSTANSTAYSNTLLKLTNGVVSLVTLPAPSATCFTSKLIYEDNKFFVSGDYWGSGAPGTLIADRCTWVSTNQGATWTVTNFPITGLVSKDGASITYANGKFFAYGRNGSTNTFSVNYRTSTDGINWTASTPISLNDATDPFAFFFTGVSSDQSIIVGTGSPTGGSKYYTTTTGSTVLATSVSTPGFTTPTRTVGWLPEINSFISTNYNAAYALELSRALAGQSWQTWAPPGTSLYEVTVGPQVGKSSVVVFTKNDAANFTKIMLSMNGGSSFSMVTTPASALNTSNVSYSIFGNKIYAGQYYGAIGVYIGTFT